MLHVSSPPIEPSAKGSASLAPTGLLLRLRECSGSQMGGCVTDSLSEASAKGVIGADRLIPERMGVFGQDTGDLPGFRVCNGLFLCAGERSIARW